MNFTALLLAGGRSRRMGSDKATILIKGQPLWRRQLDLLAGLSPNELLVSGNPGGPWKGAGCKVVADRLAESGPLAGIASALAVAEHEALLVLALDLPAMTADFLKCLLEVAAERRSGVVSRDQHRFKPMAAVYTRSCLSLAQNCLAGTDRSMQNFVRTAAARGLVSLTTLLEEDVPQFRNLNTPGDLKDCERLAAGQPGSTGAIK